MLATHHNLQVRLPSILSFSKSSATSCESCPLRYGALHMACSLIDLQDKAKVTQCLEKDMEINSVAPQFDSVSFTHITCWLIGFRTKLIRGKP